MRLRFGPDNQEHLFRILGIRKTNTLFKHITAIKDVTKSLHKDQDAWLKRIRDLEDGVKRLIIRIRVSALCDLPNTDMLNLVLLGYRNDAARDRSRVFQTADRDRIDFHGIEVSTD